MKVRTERFDDRSEPDVNGLHEYIYVGANVHFDAGAETLTFRLYDDEAGLATLVDPPGWQSDLYAGTLFRDAVAFLRAEHAINRINVYHPACGSFAPLAEAAESALKLGLPVPPDDVLQDL